jgi:hypothetical protein
MVDRGRLQLLCCYSFYSRELKIPRVWYGVCVVVDVGSIVPQEADEDSHGKERRTVSPFTALFKLVVWAARSAVLILTVLFFSVVLMFGGRK